MTLDRVLHDRLDTSRALLVPIKELAEDDRALFLAHLVTLNPEDRYLRFGSPVSDAIIAQYVSGIDFSTSSVFGVFNDDLTLAAAGHFAVLEASSQNAHGTPSGGLASAEFGLSVAQFSRGRGLGTALFVRASTHARNLGISTLFMHCLMQNRAMMRIARRAGMEICLAHGEVDASVRLAPGDSSSVMREAFQQQIALFDFAFKQQIVQSRNLLDRLAVRALV